MKIRHTANKLGLAPDSAVVIGSAGLALHGLDASAYTNRSSAFDVDAFITEAKLEEITERYSRHPSFLVKAEPFSHQVTLKRPLTRLPFTGLSGAWCNFGPLNSYQVTSGLSVTRSGIPTLPAITLATRKLQLGRSKDLAGLLQAHVIGENQGHPIVHEPSWQALIASAITKVQDGEDLMRHDDAHYPYWMNDLVEDRFEQSALQGVAC